MAINLVTGLPGNAKTLFTIQSVIAQAKAENRPVFYAGLKGFKADDPRLEGTSWTEFEPEKWHEQLPSGAIALIDEAQKVFRSRTLGAVPPKHVTELEEHRHKGLDFWMITQHPGLIDPAIRKLTQVHRHMMRIWGMEASTVHKWSGEVRDNCDKPAGRRDSEKVKWAFAKKLYGLYHSADAHTMKRTIPARVKVLFVLCALFVCALYYMGVFLKGKLDPATEAGEVVGQKQPGHADNPLQAGPVPVSRGEREAFDPMADAQHYVAMQTPRVEGLPHTAPKYDRLTEPTRVPVPSACIQIGVARAGKSPPRCRCYTQAGTPMEVEYNMCISIANHGYFLDFDAEQQRADRAERGQQVLSRVPDTPPPVRATGGSAVVALAHEVEPSRLSGPPSSAN